MSVVILGLCLGWGGVGGLGGCGDVMSGFFPVDGRFRYVYIVIAVDACAS